MAGRPRAAGGELSRNSVVTLSAMASCAMTAIAWGGLLSLEKPKSVEAEAITVAEGKMCGAAMRGVDALPWSKTPSRAKGSRRNLGDLVWSAVAEAIPDRDSKPKA